MALTREQILSTTKLLVRKVQTPDWGGDGFVYVKRLGGTALFAAQQYLESISAEIKKNARADAALKLAKLATIFICTKTGERLFKASDAKMLADGPIVPLTDCLNTALELSRMTEKAVNGLAKKSKRARRSSRG